MVVTKQISLQTKGDCDIVDITPQVEQQLAEAAINDGTVTLFVAGSTAGIRKTSPITTTDAGVMATDILMSVLRCWVPRW